MMSDFYEKAKLYKWQFISTGDKLYSLRDIAGLAYDFMIFTEKMGGPFFNDLSEESKDFLANEAIISYMSNGPKDGDAIFYFNANIIIRSLKEIEPI